MGRAAAMTFAREGASVVGCDLNVDAAEATIAMVREAGGTMVSLQPCQLTNPAECQALVDLAVRTFGRIDVTTTPRWRTSTGSRTLQMRSGIVFVAKKSTWCSISPAPHGRI